MAFRASCAFDPVQYSTVGKCNSGLSLLLWHDLPHFSKRLLNLLVFLLLFTKNATFWETLPPHPGFPIVGGHEGGAPLTLFKMGFFGAAYGWGVLFAPPPPPVNPPHISCNDETWHSYTLPKEDPKSV